MSKKRSAIDIDVLSIEVSKKIKKNPLEILYSDGSCFNTKNSEALARIVDSKGNDVVMRYKDLFTDLQLKQVDCPKGKVMAAVAKFNDVTYQNNNGAELMAMLMALRAAKKDKEIKEIRSDSQLIVEWWSTGHINKKTLHKMDKKKKKLIEECVELRKLFEERGGKIVKIDGDDNLADFGYHK